MPMPKECRKVRADRTYEGKQGFTFFEGITSETVGAQGICMHVQRIPPGGRAKAHKHATHETAIYVLSGGAEMWWGERLENHMQTAAGDLIYIPADVPHLPVNTSSEDVVAILARTDPHEQESVVLLPELDALVPD